MSYNQPPYGRPGQAPPPQAPQPSQRGYARPAYPPQQQYYYAPQGQQYIQMAPGMPQYAMMQYPPQQPPQQNQVYMTEEQYKMAQQMRYVQPQQIVYQAQPAQPQYIESRKKKKDYQTQANHSSTRKSSQVIQNYQGPVVSVPPSVQAIASKSDTQSPHAQSLEQFIPKINQTRKLNVMESHPPGCFNIVRRGGLPGIIFSQYCSVE